MPHLPYFIVVALVWLAFPLIIANTIDVAFLKRIGELGPAGDTFGALNTLFSGLAFVGLALSLRLQHRQIADNTKEIEQQKKRSSEQDFASAFYGLLGQLNANANALEVQNSNGLTVRGREVFNVLYSRWKARDHMAILNITQSEMMSTRQHFYYFHHCNSGIIDIHFCILCEILRFLADSEIDPDSHYARLVKAHVSPYECALLLYFAQCDYCPPRFKEFLERYRLLERTPEFPEISHSDILFFKREAFGSNPIYEPTVEASKASLV